MGFPARWRSHAAVTGDFDSEAAGTVHGSQAISTALIAAGTLSCLFTVDAETENLTITGKWQVSDDASTWYDVAPSNNAASVVLATGTAGADAAVSKVLVAPGEVLGWKYVRAAVTNGAAEGTSSDTFSMTLHYRVFNGFS